MSDMLPKLHIVIKKMLFKRIITLGNGFCLETGEDFIWNSVEIWEEHNRDGRGRPDCRTKASSWPENRPRLQLDSNRNEERKWKQPIQNSSLTVYPKDQITNMKDTYKKNFEGERSYVHIRRSLPSFPNVLSNVKIVDCISRKILLVYPPT